MNGKTETEERRIYFDACVYIRLIQPTDPPLASAIVGVVARAGFHGTRIVTSELTVAETLMEPVERALVSGDTTFYDRYDAGVFSSESTFQDMVAVSRDVLTLSAHLRAELRLKHRSNVKLPDAIHLASAIIGRCDTFVTGDERLLEAARKLGARSAGKPPTRIVRMDVQSLGVLESELPLP